MLTFCNRRRPTKEAWLRRRTKRRRLWTSLHRLRVNTRLSLCPKTIVSDTIRKLSVSFSHRLRVRACSHCVSPKRTLFFTWMRFGHVLKKFAFSWKTASVRFRFSARAAWTYQAITFSEFWLSGASEWALLSYWAVDVDDLTLQKASNQLVFVFAKKRAHFWTRVWLRLRLRESSPPVGDPRFRLSAFELAFTWKWDPVLESTNLPSNDNENAAFCVLFHAVGARSKRGPTDRRKTVRESRSE